MNDVQARERNDAIAAVGMRLLLRQIDIPQMVGEINMLFAKWYSDTELEKMAEQKLAENDNHIDGSAVRG